MTATARLCSFDEGTLQDIKEQQEVPVVPEYATHDAVECYFDGVVAFLKGLTLGELTTTMPSDLLAVAIWDDLPLLRRR